MTKLETRPDVYARVTAKIVADLEAGVRPWAKPWSIAHAETRITRPLRHNGEPYRGVNVLLLWAEALARGFASPTWLTFRQALAQGGHVRKGETGSLVVFADRIRRTQTTDDGDEIAREIPFMKGYTVFNVEQVDGLPEAYHATPAPPPAPIARIARAEAFFVALNAELRHGGGRAFYAIDADVIGMPPYEAFRSP